MLLGRSVEFMLHNLVILPQNSVWLFKFPPLHWVKEFVSKALLQTVNQCSILDGVIWGSVVSTCCAGPFTYMVKVIAPSTSLHWLALNIWIIWRIAYIGRHSVTPRNFFGIKLVSWTSHFYRRWMTSGIGENRSRLGWHPTGYCWAWVPLPGTMRRCRLSPHYFKPIWSKMLVNFFEVKLL